VKVVYTLRHRLHHPLQEIESSGIQEPFEHPGRAELIRAALADDPDRFEFVAPDEHGLEPIAAVHDPGLIRFLETAWQEYHAVHGPVHDVVPDVFPHPGLRAGMGAVTEPRHIGARLGWWCYETTTPITQTTYEAARASVDVAMTAARLVTDGERLAYGLCRPPGHHAARSVYGGYCFFNNAAVVANHLTTSTGGRAVVLDVDYHHGNGTQQIFYEREDVGFVSLHGDPVRAYPYLTGFAEEQGSGPGRGATANHPLPAGLDDDGYLAALAVALEQVAAMRPDVLVVSLGVDTFGGDPISDLALTADGFERCGAAIAALGLPTVVLQEGGYADEALGENVRRWLVGAAGGS
jgi:acetoin utilization deacetylase AcuC-like enzyme